MTELFSEVKQELKRRFMHPFLSSFLIALATANYKVFFVLSSDESYRGKFNYLETVLYPNAVWASAMFLVIPATFAVLLTFVWPLVDAEISVVWLRLENRKKRKLLIENRKEPVDSDLQAEYFERFDRELTEFKGRLMATHDRDVKLYKELGTKLNQVSERLRNQSLFRVIEFTDLSIGEFQRLLDSEPWMLAEDEKLSERAKRIPHLEQMKKVFAAIDQLPFTTPDFRKIANMGWLSNTLEESPERVSAFYEIMHALGIFGAVVEDGNSFEILQNDSRKFNRLHALVSSVCK